MEMIVLLVPILIMLSLSIAAFVFWLRMHVHCLRGESPNKIVWVVTILLLNFLGALLYRVIEYPRTALESVEAQQSA